MAQMEHLETARLTIWEPALALWSLPKHLAGATAERLRLFAESYLDAIAEIGPSPVEGKEAFKSVARDWDRSYVPPLGLFCKAIKTQRQEGRESAVTLPAPPAWDRRMGEPQRIARAILATPLGLIAKRENLGGIVLDMVVDRTLLGPAGFTAEVLDRSRRIKRDFDLAMVQALSIINPALRETTLGLGQAIAGHAALVD